MGLGGVKINYANYFGGQHFFCTWNGEGLPKTGRPK